MSLKGWSGKKLKFVNSFETNFQVNLLHFVLHAAANSKAIYNYL